MKIGEPRFYTSPRGAEEYLEQLKKKGIKAKIETSTEKDLGLSNKPKIIWMVIPDKEIN